jgi:hypothetical protein
MQADMTPHETLDRLRTNIVQEHYSQSKDFTEEAIGKASIKRSAPFSQSKFFELYIADNTPPADPSAYLDNEIPPFFTEDKWLVPANASMSNDQLLPALRLASKLVTHDRALQWFAHVYYAYYFEQHDAPPLLLRNAGPITKDMLKVVKTELLKLAPS